MTVNNINKPRQGKRTGMTIDRPFLLAMTLLRAMMSRKWEGLQLHVMSCLDLLTRIAKGTTHLCLLSIVFFFFCISAWSSLNAKTCRQQTSKEKVMVFDRVRSGGKKSQACVHLTRYYGRIPFICFYSRYARWTRKAKRAFRIESVW